MEISFPVEKKHVMIRHDKRELIKFALSIPEAELKNVISELRAFERGFRPGKDLGVRLHAFFARIHRWQDSDWDIMADIWIKWSEIHLLRPSGLLMSRDEFLETVGRMLNDDLYRALWIKRLIWSRIEKPLDRSKIRDWLHFGPLCEDPYTEEIINLEYSVLTSYLSLREQCHSIAATQDAARTSIMSIQDEIHQIRADLKESAAANDKLSQITNQMAHITSTVDSLAARLDTEMTNLTKETKLSIIMQEEVYEFKTALANVERTLGQALQKLKELEQGQVNGSMYRPEVRSGEIDDKGDLGFGQACVHVKELSTGSTVVPIQLKSLDEALEHVTDNLYHLGIRKPLARRLASEIIAALTAGQIVTFEGTYASTVAECCAISLGATKYYRLNIPVGLVDGSQIEMLVSRWTKQVRSDDSVVAVVIEGLNRSSLEVYGDALSKLVVDRTLYRESALEHSSLLLFATLVSGPSSIRSIRNTICLGPIFNTEFLGWTDRVPSQPKPATVLKCALREISCPWC